MKKLLHIILILIISSCSPQDPQSTTSDELVEENNISNQDPQLTTSDKLVEKNNITYFGDSKTPFTGEIVDYHSNQNLKMTGNYVDGKKEGQWDIFFYQPKDGSPVKEYEEFYTNGERDGIFTRFNSGDGSVREKTYYVNGEFDKKLVFRGVGIDKKIFHKNNRIYEIKYLTPIENDEDYLGKIECKITDKTTNKPVYLYNQQHTDGVQKIYSKGLISEEITWKDCQKNGVYNDYVDGFISKKGFYKNDKKSGEWTTYHEETGNILKISNYKEDEYHGLVKEYDKKGNEILLTETQYIDGKRDGLQKDYDKKTGKLYRSRTYIQGGLNGETVLYTNLNQPPLEVFKSHLYDFWNVMSPSGKGGYGKSEGFNNGKKSWKYTNKSCEDHYRKDRNEGVIDCLGSQKNLYVTDNTPIKITMNYQGGVRHGPLEISDPDDGHIYTSIEYFRGGKYGEYKITNKEGNVIFSVNCLKGGKDYTYYYTTKDDTFSGKCRKDGEEIKYRRSVFSPNQDWYLHSKKVFKNDKVVEDKYFVDPFYQEGMIFNSEVVLSFVKDPNLIKGEK